MTRTRPPTDIDGLGITEEEAYLSIQRQSRQHGRTRKAILLRDEVRRAGSRE